MFKRIILLKRKPGITQEEFSKYWREHHASLAARVIPGLKKYVQNHPRGSSTKGEIGGIAELWFDDLESAEYAGVWRETDAARELREDESKFIDMTIQWVRLVAEEYVVM